MAGADLLTSETEDMQLAAKVLGLQLPTEHEYIDSVEEAISRCPAYDPPVEHCFTPGLYARTCSPCAGALFTSKIHKKEHQFVLQTGVISVVTIDNDGAKVVTLHAPAHGITKPGTRRIVFCHLDTVFTTFHPTECTDLAEIESDLIVPHNNPLLQREGALV